ncbi:MAG: 50S ribosomal protein L18 [Deltaproteobacteria bacterium]|nr:50S ribosomal protein L18 [Deltaproteobacteria bacterium]
MRRVNRVRSRIQGTVERPRLSVFRTSRYIYVQAIDDSKGQTLAEASSLSSEFKGALGGLNKVDAAKKVGALMGKRLIERNITAAVFDRGRFLYHGRVKALAEAVREAGIKM